MQQKDLRTHHSLEKALKLLGAFIPDNREMGTVELAQHFDLHRSTVSRVLATLKANGYVRLNPETRKFSIGPIIAELYAAYRRSFSSIFLQIAKPVMEELRNDIGQTVVLEVPSDNHTVLAHVAETYGPFRIKGGVGDMHHYHISAGGKCILAFSSEEFIARILNSELLAMTPKTIVQPSEIRAELAKIREVGFAYDGECNNLGINAFGVPIVDRDGRPIAGLVIAGASNLVSWNQRSRFVEALKQSAEKISAALNNTDQKTAEN